MKWFLCLLLGLMVMGCSPGVKYEYGVVTEEIKGVITVPAGAHPLVLVRMSVATFAIQGQGQGQGPGQGQGDSPGPGPGQVQESRARLVYPGPKGSYTLHLDDDVSHVDLYFIAQGYKYAVASFDRTLGVRAYVFDVTLKTDSNPKMSYFLGLKPLLSQYIMEPRYLMPPHDQMVLTRWMDQVETKLYPIEKP